MVMAINQSEKIICYHGGGYQPYTHVLSPIERHRHAGGQEEGLALASVFVYSVT